VIFYFKETQVEGGLLRNICKFVASTSLRISVINYFTVNYNQARIQNSVFDSIHSTLTPARVAAKKNKG
jgi:hypothetical protein